MSRTQNILADIAKNGRVAGAYLFSGEAGTGKKTGAEDFAKSLGCQKQDVIIIEPDGASLKIEQIRALQQWVRFGPTVSPYLVAILERADTLTGQASAAFLKTLEEPAPGVVFILLAEREDKLPATILSRCQKIIFGSNQSAWQKQAGFTAWYQGLLNCLDQRKTAAALQWSAELAKDKEQIENLLYDLVHYCRYELANIKAARIILDTVRYLKRRANTKLALDVMCLKLGAG